MEEHQKVQLQGWMTGGRPLRQVQNVFEEVLSRELPDGNDRRTFK